MRFKSIFSALAVVCALSACHQPGNDPTPAGEANYMARSPKRGISFNGFSDSDRKLLCPAVSWVYNWGSSANEAYAADFDAYGVEYCPMVWSGKPNVETIRAYVTAHPSTKYLLAFNEPNLKDQANMTPSQAAALWPDVVAAARELNLKIVSPAMNYGTLAGYSDPEKWLDEFFRQPGVSLDDVDAISVHCYMASMSALQGFIEKFRKYNKPVWLTEFCAWDPAPSNAEKQLDFMSHSLNYLEQEPLVERYCWFMLKSNKALNTVPFNQLVNHELNSQLTPQGEVYTLFSTFDKDTYLNTCRAIHAGEYVATTNNAIVLRPTTDYVVYGKAGVNGLMLTNFANGTMLTYQINVEGKPSELIMHYCSFANTQMTVLVDNKIVGTYEMPRNGSLEEWTSVSLPVKISAGKHTIAFMPESGSCAFSGFQVK